MSLKSLILDFNSIKAEGGLKIAELLPLIKSPLQHLSLVKNEIQDKAAVKLIKAALS